MASEHNNSDNTGSPEKREGDNVSDESINLGALYFKTGILARYVVKNWGVLIIGALIGTILAFGFIIYKGTTYTAPFSFNVMPSSSSSVVISNSLAIAGGGGGSSIGSTGGFDNNYFSVFVQSQRNVKEALLKTGVVNGKNDFLANHFIDVYKWRGSWEGTKLDGFKFKTGNLFQLNQLEDSVLTLEYNYVLKYNLTITYTAGNAVVAVSLNTLSKDLTRELGSELYNCMNYHYLNDIRGRNELNVVTAQHKVDSLASLMHSLDDRIAHFNDNNFHLVKQQGGTELTNLTRDRTLLTTLYNSAVSNLDAAKTTLNISLPLLDIVDDPKFATVVTFIKWQIALPIGAIAGVFFAIIYLVVRRLVIESAIKEKRKMVEQTSIV